MTFQGSVDFSYAIFLGDTKFQNVTFKRQVIFDCCQFEACFELQYTHFEKSASSIGLNFQNGRCLRRNLSIHATLTGQPSGKVWTLLDGQKLLEVDVVGLFRRQNLQNVVFIEPDQVSFSEVDLSRVHFRGTNLRGVRFLNVSWWQPSLGRNGLYDEIFM